MDLAWFLAFYDYGVFLAQKNDIYIDFFKGFQCSQIDLRKNQIALNRNGVLYYLRVTLNLELVRISNKRFM